MERAGHRTGDAGRDDDNTNDEQWPYKVSFSETNMLGVIALPEDSEPHNIILNYDVSFPVDNENYSGATISLNTEELAGAFSMQPNQILAELGDSIEFYGVNSNGDLIAETTANGYGHWFDESGDVIGWGDAAMVYSEFEGSSFNFKIGQYPGHSDWVLTFIFNELRRFIARRCFEANI